jgi:acyl carrier protein
LFFLPNPPDEFQVGIKQQNMYQPEEKFSRILKYMGIPNEEVRPDASFVKDFEFNDFQFNCLVYYITNYFDIKVKDSDYPQLTTIGSTLNFIRSKKGFYSRSLSSVNAKKGSKKAVSY